MYALLIGEGSAMPDIHEMTMRVNEERYPRLFVPPTEEEVARNVESEEAIEVLLFPFWAQLLRRANKRA